LDLSAPAEVIDIWLVKKEEEPVQTIDLDALLT
jgi:hypothetical protein